VVCGHYTDNGAVEIHPHWQINRKHVELRGCWGSRYEHFHRATQIAARFGRATGWRDLVGATFPLAEADAALRSIERRETVKALIRAAG
jgi:L-iditol 2-dehydrogenase